MIGVVVWTDQKLGKAVIWCEDQNDLAYYVRSKLTQNADITDVSGQVSPLVDPHLGADDYIIFREGDLVTFDSYYEGRCRMARGLSLLEEETHSQLADILHEESDVKEDRAVQRTPCQGTAGLNTNLAISASIRPLPGLSRVQTKVAQTSHPKEMGDVVQLKAAGRKRQIG